MVRVTYETRRNPSLSARELLHAHEHPQHREHQVLDEERFTDHPVQAKRMQRSEQKSVLCVLCVLC
ncbi:MAG: hypothetical protein ABI134_28955, partial [Byssovorax sp.]